MTTWIQLSPDKVHSQYRVPLDIATSEENTFFGTQCQPGNNPYDDGPWSLVAFLGNQEQPNVVTFQISHIDFEDLEFEDFNPLTDYAGHLNLEKQELIDLINLLISYAKTIKPTQVKTTKMFVPLDYLKLVDFRFDTFLFPKMKQKFYYQVYEPRLKAEDDSTATIVSLSTGPEQPSHTYLKVSHFLLKSLGEPSFNPADYSIGKINLDRSGMEELASILQTHLINFGQ